jgi:hypothetical protein
MQAPFWQWWGSEASKHSNTTKNGGQDFLSRFHGNAKGFKLPKFEMPGATQIQCSIDKQLLYSNILEAVMPVQSMWMLIL